MVRVLCNGLWHRIRSCLLCFRHVLVRLSLWHEIPRLVVLFVMCVCADRGTYPFAASVQNCWCCFFVLFRLCLSTLVSLWQPAAWIELRSHLLDSVWSQTPLGQMVLDHDDAGRDCRTRGYVRLSRSPLENGMIFRNLGITLRRVWLHNGPGLLWK